MITKVVETCMVDEPKRFDNGAYAALHIVNEENTKMLISEELEKKVDNIIYNNSTITKLSDLVNISYDLMNDYSPKKLMDLFEGIYTADKALYHDIIDIIHLMLFAEQSCIFGNMKRDLCADIIRESFEIVKAYHDKNMTGSPEIAKPEFEELPEANEKYITFTNDIGEGPCLCKECDSECENVGKDMTHILRNQEDLCSNNSSCLCAECDEDCENAGKDLTPDKE